MHTYGIGDIVMFDGHLDIVMAVEADWLIRGKIALAMSQSVVDPNDIRLIKSKDDLQTFLKTAMRWYAEQDKVKNLAEPARRF